jgi:trehalose 6-phosphate phosphatase
MKALLTRENRVLLDQLAWSNVLLAFDFDGTLAPIVADRDRAEMRPRTARLFAKVCERYPSAVISGRAKADVARRLGAAPVRFLIGNHGLEPGTRLSTFGRQVERARPLLETALIALPGVDIEDKRYSLAVHYRRAREKPRAREAIRRAVAALPVPMRVIPGKLVINVVPEAAPSKGDALVALRERADADVAMYIGDDVTDEDVFRLDQPGRLFTIRIGRSRTSAARYYLRQQAEIDQLLLCLATLRSAAKDRPAAGRAANGHATPGARRARSGGAA